MCYVPLVTEQVCGGRVRCMAYTAAAAAAVSDTDTAADVSTSRCNGQLVTATSNGRVHVWTLHWSDSSQQTVATATSTSESSEQSVPICTITVAATKTVLGEPRCVVSITNTISIRQTPYTSFRSYTCIVQNKMLLVLHRACR
jgi:hypothetical protein